MLIGMLGNDLIKFHQDRFPEEFQLLRVRLLLLPQYILIILNSPLQDLDLRLDHRRFPLQQTDAIEVFMLKLRDRFTQQEFPFTYDRTNSIPQFFDLTLHFVLFSMGFFHLSSNECADPAPKQDPHIDTLFFHCHFKENRGHNSKEDHAEQFIP